MQLNSFSVRIPEGAETQSGYVELPHKQQYSILIHNYRDTDCITQVYVDGKDVGRFHIKAKANLKLERPENANRKFLFLSVDTEDAKSAEGETVEVDCRGLVQASFFPLKKSAEKSDVEKMMDELKKHIAESLGHHHIHHHHEYWWPSVWPYRQPFWIYMPTVTWECTDQAGSRTWQQTSGGTLGSNCTYTCNTSGGAIGATEVVDAAAKTDDDNALYERFQRPIPAVQSIMQAVKDEKPKYGAGITGLGEVSSQELPVADVEPEELLYETTISLRLVAVPEQRKTIGALKPIVRGNPIPPPVGT